MNIEHSAGSAITITPKRNTLATLPSPSWSLFGDRPPWQILSAAALAEILDVDHALIAIWRQRRLGPQALPPSWFKAHALGYRIADAWRWLASRHGLPLPTDEALALWWYREVGELEDELFASDPTFLARMVRGGWCDPEGVRLTALGRAEAHRFLG